MAPTIPAAVTCSKEHLHLTNKQRKPLVEKMRRDRINTSIEQLKSLLGPEILSQQPDSRQEKADILEMTVCFLRLQHQHQHQPVRTSSSSSAVSEGYSRCLQQVVSFLSQDEGETQSQKRLLSHLQNLQPSSDINRSQNVLHQMNSPAQNNYSKEKNFGNTSIWRPW